MEIGNEVEVKSLEDNHLYPSISEAARILNTTAVKIRDSLECRTKCIRGLHMVYVDQSRNNRYERYFPEHNHQEFFNDYMAFLNGKIDQDTLYSRYGIKSKEQLKSMRRIARVEKNYDLYSHILDLREHDRTIVGIAAEVGKSYSYVSRLLRSGDMLDVFDERSIIHYGRFSEDGVETSDIFEWIKELRHADDES